MLALLAVRVFSLALENLVRVSCDTDEFFMSFLEGVFGWLRR